MVLGTITESSGPLLAVVTPLIMVPLTLITFYLRSMREHQLSKHAELAHRIERLEEATGGLRGVVARFERDFSTKEEWLRECMFARRRLEQLGAATVRLEAVIQTFGGTGRRRGEAGSVGALGERPSNAGVPNDEDEEHQR